MENTVENNVENELSLDKLLDSVSSGDAGASVSGGDAGTFYEINVYMLPESTSEPELETEIEYTLWDKPLEEYTVSEGLLLLLVVIALIALIWAAIRGGAKWQI